ncbi:MAG: patatin-like phospholipase family protein [Rubrivivax sp.]|nr:patatin-like phospholipase family protein [Rubrivivax sp.]
MVGDPSIFWQGPSRPAVVPQTAGLRRRSLLATLLLAGCALEPDANHDGHDAPASAPLPRAPRTAWVFSSGGPRGFVHVGVLKALDELGLVPDVIVGASAGAAVGCLRAAGRSAREIETLALDLQPWGLARVAVGASERLSGSGLAELMREQARHRLLQDLPIPMVCVAQRLADRSVVAFNRGDLGLAVQASAAIEGQFAPVRIHGQRHADADLVMPLPVRVVRALGATRVLAVDASAHEDLAPPGTERWRPGDLRKRALTRPDADSADVLLHPEFGYYTGFSREYRERCIAAGHRATLAAAPALRALHAV